MKKILFLLLIIPVTTLDMVFAQKVKYENEIISKDGQPYALMKKKGGLIREFSVRTLKDKEVIFIKNESDKPYFEVIFLQSEKRAYLDASEDVGLNAGKSFAKMIVENDLITAEGINPEGEKRFLLLYGEKPTNETKTPNNQNTDIKTGYQTIERNRSGTIRVFRDKIEQDFKEIGYFSQSEESKDGKILRIYQFFLPNGTLIARTTFEGISSKEGILVTSKDNAIHNVSIRGDVFAAEDIAKFLIERLYL